MRYAKKISFLFTTDNLLYPPHSACCSGVNPDISAGQRLQEFPSVYLFPQVEQDKDSVDGLISILAEALHATQLPYLSCV